MKAVLSRVHDFTTPVTRWARRRITRGVEIVWHRVARLSPRLRALHSLAISASAGLVVAALTATVSKTGFAKGAYFASALCVLVTAASAIILDLRRISNKRVALASTAICLIAFPWLLLKGAFREFLGPVSVSIFLALVAVASTWLRSKLQPRNPRGRDEPALAKTHQHALSPSPERNIALERAEIQNRQLASMLERKVSELAAMRSALGDARRDRDTASARAVQAEALGRTFSSFPDAINGRWRLIEPLRGADDGGQGLIFLAQDLNAKGSSAGAVAKLLRVPDSLKFDEARSRLTREIEILSRCSHSNIVKFLDGGYDLHLGRWFIVTRYYCKGSVSHHVASGSMPPARWVFSIFCDVLRALDYLHTLSNPVIHRDIKPANILISDDGRHAVVTDFGIAKALGREGARLTDNAMASMFYAAPEILLNKACPASDLYGAAAVFYELLAGFPPYGDIASDSSWPTYAGLVGNPSIRPTALEQINGRFGRIPNQISDFVDNCLADSPQNRPRTAQRALRTLEEILRSAAA